MRLARVPLTLLLAATLSVAGAPTRLSADDVAINKDWKESVKKNPSPAFAKERAEFWEKKGVTGKDTFWIGFMWEKAGLYDKAITAFEAYAKLPDAHEGNRETALTKIMECHADKKDLEKAIAAGETLLKTYPGSKIFPSSQRQVARLYRQHGTLDKALAYFSAAADGKDSFAVTDLVDMHLVAGDVPKAQAACEKGLALFEKAGLKESFTKLKALVDRVGQPYAFPEGVKLVTGGDAPTAWGPKATFLMYTPLVMQGVEGNLRTLAQMHKGYGEALDVYGVVTYMRFDPFTKKEDPTLSDEKESQMIAEVLGKESGGAAVLLLPKAGMEAGAISETGQKILLDGEGKLRWVRNTHQNQYDWYCVEQALKKFVGG